MKEVADHIGPEPCVAARKGVDEASVGEGGTGKRCSGGTPRSAEKDAATWSLQAQGTCGISPGAASGRHGSGGGLRAGFPARLKLYQALVGRPGQRLGGSGRGFVHGAALRCDHGPAPITLM